MEEQKLLELVRNHIPACEKHFEFLKEIIHVCEEIENMQEQLKTDLDFKAHISILQFNFLLTNSDLELCLAFKSLITAESKWEKIYFIKLANLNIYETLNAYNKHRKTVKEISEKIPELEKVFKTINKNIALFSNKFGVETKINKVRNKTIGHIENNMKQYFQIVLDLDYDISVKMVYEFMVLLQTLHEFSLACLMSTGPKIPEGFDVEKNYEDMKKEINYQNKNTH